MYYRHDGRAADVNTENPDFQYYYMQYVNDLIANGARGFRYDTAKHIGLPSDPVDSAVIAAGGTNDFWDIATGRKAIRDITLSMPDSLFIYGEVLQDRNVPEKGYGEYMSLTASSYGAVLRHVLEARQFPRRLHHGLAPCSLARPAGHLGRVARHLLQRQ